MIVSRSQTVKKFSEERVSFGPSSNMRFTETPFKRRAFIIEFEPQTDARGSFARTFCARELGIRVWWKISCNATYPGMRAGLRCEACTIKRLHRARSSWCVAQVGALWDVIVDLREESPTHLQWFGIELSVRNRKALYIPEMFAHGFQTLEDGTEVFYQMSEFYSPGSVHWLALR